MLSLVLASVLAAGPRAGAAVELDKKAEWLAAKRAPAPRRGETCGDDPRCREPLKAGDAAEPVLYARHLHTLEVMPLRGQDPARLRRFFRCRFTDEPADHPAELIAGVIAAADHFERREIHVISGFRHPKFNLMLTKKGREAARDSQHTKSQAIDFTLPGVDASKLYKYALKQWKGGVGYYPVSQFVHLDTGKRRTWKGT
jgi:hypothetical protein